MPKALHIAFEVEEELELRFRELEVRTPPFCFCSSHLDSMKFERGGLQGSSSFITIASSSIFVLDALEDHFSRPCDVTMAGRHIRQRHTRRNYINSAMTGWEPYKCSRERWNRLFEVKMVGSLKSIKDLDVPGIQVHVFQAAESVRFFALDIDLGVIKVLHVEGCSRYR